MPSTSPNVVPGARISTAWALILVLGVVLAALVWLAGQLQHGLGL